MGSRYYSGVPSMSEQFTPVLTSAIKKRVINRKNGRGRSGSIVFASIILFLMGLPLTFFWSALMIVGESFKLFLSNGSDPIREKQLRMNIKFASVMFGISFIFYWYFYNNIALFRFVVDSFLNILF